jgi:hypothetical protein
MAHQYKPHQENPSYSPDRILEIIAHDFLPLEWRLIFSLNFTGVVIRISQEPLLLLKTLRHFFYK